MAAPPKPRIKRHSPAMKAHVRSIEHEVVHLPDRAILHVRRQLGDVRRELRGAFAEWFKGRDLKATMTSADYHALVRFVRAGGPIRSGMRVPKEPRWVDVLERTLLGGLKESARDAGRMAQRHIMRQALGLETSRPAAIHPVSSATIIERGEKALLPRLTGAAETVASRAFEDIKRKTLMGVSQDETVVKVAATLWGESQEMVLTSEATSAAEGIAQRIFNLVAGQCDRTVRTETANAYNTMADETITALAEENPEIVMMKRWDAELDQVLCDECRELHGDTVEVDESFPNGEDAPPLHPNCRCLLTIITEPRKADDKPEDAPN